MTYPDDVMKAAREAAASCWTLAPRKMQHFREGKLDIHPEVLSAARAIMAERQAVASWLNNMDPQLADAIERGEHRKENADDAS